MRSRTTSSKPSLSLTSSILDDTFLPQSVPKRVALLIRYCYNMCMHSNSRSVDTLIDSIAQMDEQALDRLQAAIDYLNGVLQLEGRAYRRKKDGELTETGPYWYFHYREGGKQRTLYIGKTNNPEAKVDEIMEGE